MRFRDVRAGGDGGAAPLALERQVQLGIKAIFMLSIYREFLHIFFM